VNRVRFSRLVTIAVVVFLVLSLSFSGVAAPVGATSEGLGISDSSDVTVQTDGPGAGPTDPDDDSDNESDSDNPEDSSDDSGNWVGDDFDPGTDDSNESTGEDEGTDDSATDEDGGVDEGDEEDPGSISDGLLDGTVDFVSGVIPDVPDVPTPAEATEQIWSYMAVQFHAGFVQLVDEVFNNLLGTPKIHNDGPMGIFGAPTTIDSGAETADRTDADEYDAFASALYADLYDSVYLPFVMPLVFSIMGLAAIGVLVGPALSAITHHRMLSILGSAVFAVILVVASWEFAALIHALSDSATQFFLPDSEELLGEEAFDDADETAAAGPIATAVGFSILGISKGLILAIIHGLRHSALYVFPLVLPLLLLLAYFGVWQKVKLVGSVLIWQYYALLVMNIPTALLLRIAYEAEWQFIAGEAAFFANLAATMGVFFIAIIIPLFISGSFLLIGLSMRGATMGTAMGAAGAIQQRRHDTSFGGGRPVNRRRSFRDRVLGPNRSVARGGTMLAGAGAYYGGRKAVASVRNAGSWARNQDGGKSARALLGTKRTISASSRKAAARARARLGNRSSGSSN
jgi:hypothetical protein